MEHNSQSKILPIVGYGSPILRTVCEEVDASIDKVHLLSNDILATMQSIGTAVGLAAPQVNEALRIFAARISGKVIVFINPSIKKHRGTKKSDEACLSIPNVTGTVAERYEIIDVEFYDVDMKHQKIRLRGFDAIVFQHEFDHLNGILYTDRLTKEGLEAVNDKLSDIEKGIHSARYEMVFTHLLKDPQKL